MDPSSPFSKEGPPPPLEVAAALTGIQGLVTAMYGIAEGASVHSGRVVMGVTTALFFMAYGVGLMICAWGMHRARPWSRGPVLFAQLVWLGIAWSFRAGSTTVLAVGLAVVAVLVLAGLLAPSSVTALDRPEHRSGDDTDT